MLREHLYVRDVPRNVHIKCLLCKDVPRNVHIKYNQVRTFHGTSIHNIQIKLESLILAQNERWRQA